MSAIPRIIVVDDTEHEINPIVQGALALLDRQSIVIDVPTSDAALQEVQNSSIDLVVTAFDIDGSLDGLTLAQHVSRESLDTSVIVLASQYDPKVNDDELQDAPFQFFVRPVAEAFMRGLRVALDGEAALADDVAAAGGGGPELGPVPDLDLDEMRNVIMPMARDVGAMGVILADRTGRILLELGATTYIDREKLTVLLGPSFSRGAEMSSLIGGKAWTMHYYDGERLDVFGLALGIHFFMCLLFEGSNRGALGAVTMFGRRAADQMIEKIGEAAYQTMQVAPAKAAKATRAASKGRATSHSRRRAAEEDAAEAASPATAASATTGVPDQPPAGLDVLFDETEAGGPESEAKPLLDPVVDFDPEALFGQSVDENVADTLFDEAAVSDLASSLNSDQDERVGFDEAKDMGIVGIDD